MNPSEKAEVGDCGGAKSGQNWFQVGHARIVTPGSMSKMAMFQQLQDGTDAVDASSTCPDGDESVIRRLVGGCPTRVIVEYLRVSNGATFLSTPSHRSGTPKLEQLAVLAVLFPADRMPRVASEIEMLRQVAKKAAHLPPRNGPHERRRGKDHDIPRWRQL